MYVITSHSVPLRMRNISDKSCTENRNSHFMFNTPPPQSCHFLDNLEKYVGAVQAIDDNMAHAHCVLHV